MAYDWRSDALASYTLAMRLKALAVGSRPFQTIPEMYWQELNGVIP